MLLKKMVRMYLQQINHSYSSCFRRGEGSVGGLVGWLVGEYEDKLDCG